MQAEAGRRMREKPLPKDKHNSRVRVAGRGRGQLLWSIHLAAGFVGDGCLWVYFLSFSFYMVIICSQLSKERVFASCPGFASELSLAAMSSPR